MPRLFSQSLRVAGLALTALAALTACDKKPAKSNKSLATAPAPKPTTKARGVPLAPLLAEIPEDTQWAVVVGHLGLATRHAGKATALFAEHPRFRGPLHRLTRRVTRVVGFRLLDPQSRRAAGLPDDAALVVARRQPAQSPPVTLVMVRGVKPLALLKGLTRALRRRGDRAIPEVKTHHVAGRTLLQFDGRWSCGFRQGLTRCADVAPGRWDRVFQGGGGGLRKRQLHGMTDQELTGTGGVFLGAQMVAPLWTGLERWIRPLVGVPKLLWLGVHFDHQIHLRGFLRTRDTPDEQLPRISGPSGLAAATDADLALRLRVTPTQLGAGLRTWARNLTLLTALTPTQKAQPAFWNGDVLLFSTASGLAARLGVARPTAAARALKRLDLLLTTRLADWQRRVRENGVGWDLRYTREQAGDTPIYRLLLKFPKGATSPYPTVRGGELRLCWGLVGRHVLWATDPRLFRHLRTHVDKPDQAFLASLPEGGARRAFTRPARLALLLRPDDPFTSLPAPQRAALARLLETLSPQVRRPLRLLRAISDLTSEVAVTLHPRHHHGMLVEGTLTLVRAPGDGLRLPATYRRALVKKWGGNHSGFRADLRHLAANAPAGPVRRKARRSLPPPGAAPHSGWLGWLASVYAPWRVRTHRTHIHASGQAGLAHLGARLAAFAEAALATSKAPESLRHRWVRRLVETPLTPARSCCKTADRQCQSQAADWRHPTWKALGFQMSGPHRYRYQVRVKANSTATHLELRAVGDPDCDGRSTQLLLPATVAHDTGRLTLGPIKRIHRE